MPGLTRLGGCEGKGKGTRYNIGRRISIRTLKAKAHSWKVLNISYVHRKKSGVCWSLPRPSLARLYPLTPLYHAPITDTSAHYCPGTAGRLENSGTLADVSRPYSISLAGLPPTPVPGTSWYKYNLFSTFYTLYSHIQRTPDRREQMTWPYAKCRTVGRWDTIV